MAVAGLGLGLSACLWWLYFGGDDDRAERALGAMPPVERAWAALTGFGYWHIPMLLGIVTVAAAERRAFAKPFAELGWPLAALLGGGIAAFLIGDVLFRRALGIGRMGVRGGAAALAVATLPLGAAVFPAAQIGALVALLVAAIAVEARLERSPAPAVPRTA